MSDDKDKAIRRLKKLMALTSSSNANEASAALARAQKLMEASLALLRTMLRFLISMNPSAITGPLGPVIPRTIWRTCCR